MSRIERFLNRPGEAKRARIRSCLHEAAHAVAFSKLFSVAATAEIFGDDRGVSRCRCVGSEIGKPRYLIAYAVGAIAEDYAFAVAVPRIRYRRRRKSSRKKIRPSDGEVLRRHCLTSVPTNKSIDFDLIDVAAVKFVDDNLAEIINVAHKLYIRGRVYLPASKENLPSNVSPVSTIAARRGSF